MKLTSLCHSGSISCIAEVFCFFFFHTEGICGGVWYSARSICENSSVVGNY